MKISTYGAKPEPALLALLIAELLEDAKVVLIKTPLRNPPNAKPCQMPNGVIYEVNIDNTRFITLISKHPNDTPEIKHA